MARPSNQEIAIKEKSDEIAKRILENQGSDVHHMTRRLAQHPNAPGASSGEQVDFDLRVWLAAGYKLHTAHYIGSEPGVVNMLYILVRE